MSQRYDDRIISAVALREGTNAVKHCVRGLTQLTKRVICFLFITSNLTVALNIKLL